VTKRRRLWSSCQRWATTLLGSLLLNAAPSIWAAGDAPSPSGKALASKTVRAVNKPVRAARPKPRAAMPSDSEVGPAEVLVSDTPGLNGQTSFYGRGFTGRKTANGDRFDVRLFTGASNHFPLGSKVAVRRLDNDRCAIVKVNDRMHAKHRRRVIDVSLGVAEYLDMLRAGVVLVRVAAVKAGTNDDSQSDCHAAFEPDDACNSCGQPPKLPDFGDVFFPQN